MVGEAAGQREPAQGKRQQPATPKSKEPEATQIRAAGAIAVRTPASRGSWNERNYRVVGARTAPVEDAGRIVHTGRRRSKDAGPEHRRQRARCEASRAHHATRPARCQRQPPLGNNHMASTPPHRSQRHSSEANATGDEATHLSRGRHASPGQHGASPALTIAPAPRPATAYAAEELGCVVGRNYRGPAAGPKPDGRGATPRCSTRRKAGGKQQPKGTSRAARPDLGAGEGVGAQRHGRTDPPCRHHPRA